MFHVTPGILKSKFKDNITLLCVKIPSNPDLFRSFPPVMVPIMESFFSIGVIGV